MDLIMAHVLNNVVTTCSVWDHDPTEEERARYSPATLHDVTGLRVASGWRLVEGEWVEPEAEPGSE